MDIKSVTSGTNTLAASRAVPTQETPQTQQSQAAEKRQPKEAERTKPAEEAPRPVVNADGQKTGTIINVTA